MSSQQLTAAVTAIVSAIITVVAAKDPGNILANATVDTAVVAAAAALASLAFVIFTHASIKQVAAPKK